MRVCLKEPDVLEKFPLGKNDQNLLKNEVFRLFCRLFLDLADIGTK